MFRNVLPAIITSLLFNMMFMNAKAQNTGFTAVLSIKGQAYYHLNLPTFILDISQDGRLISFASSNHSPIEYSTERRVEKIGSDTISWDLEGRLLQVGKIRIGYDINNRLVSAGNIKVEYDFISGHVTKINNRPIDYDFLTGKVTRISKTTIQYNMYGEVSNISDAEKIVTVRSASLSAN